MELLVTLRKKSYLNRINELKVDGVIIGSLFSMGYDYELSDLKAIVDYCKKSHLKVYVTIDTFIKEDDKQVLFSYLELLDKMNINGLFFHDLAVVDASKNLLLKNRLVFDGKTMASNSLDVSFYLSKGINSVVLSRALSFKEIVNIVANHENKVDLQVFGRLELSYSKRFFLSNYFKEIGMTYYPKEKRNLSLVEEKRDYALPILESDYGTRIYSDYVFEMYELFPKIKPYINKAIIDDIFVNEDVFFNVCRDLCRISEDNAEYLRENLIRRYPEINFTNGFLYEKSSIRKEESE